MQAELLVSETYKCVDVANKKLGILYPYPKVQFDLKGTTAGEAYSVSNRIRYNLGIAISNWNDFIGTTVPHEVAHLVADFYFKYRCNHGPDWQYVMKEVYGLEPIRCHKYDVSEHYTRKVVRYQYRCDCSEPCKVGPKYHKKLQSGMVSIRCIRCKKVLTRNDHYDTVVFNKSKE